MSPGDNHRSSSMSSDSRVSATHTVIAKAQLRLPSLSLSTSSSKPDHGLLRKQIYAFDPETLAAAIASGCSAQAIKDYLQHYERTTVTAQIDDQVKDQPLVAYAVERNDTEILQLLLENGADPSVKAFGTTPVLAFAIMRTKWTQRNATDVVKTLLAYGVNPRCVPRDMWEEYVKMPKAELPTSGHRSAAKWCTPEHRAVLVETLNLSMRYFLWRASHLQPPTMRTLQIGTAQKVIPLFRIPYQIIGQMVAAKMVMDEVYAYLSLNTRKPLVLAFAGLSGHGKTELATQMEHMLSLKLLDLDCAQIKTEHNLLGPPIGYTQNSVGSPLNDHLTAYSGRRCVIFLDEFDKTNKECRDALLKVLDTGAYRDRKTNKEVDGSRFIWMLAANLGDTAIADFHYKHMAALKGEEVDKISIKPLRTELSGIFRNAFSPPIAGRIDTIVPFFPFSPTEAAVVAHKFILDLQDEVRKPIATAEPELRYIAHSDLCVIDDGKVCQHLVTNHSYEPELGARSISTSVNRLRTAFALEYSKSDVKVQDEFNERPLQRYIVQLNPVSETEEDISVFRDERTVLSGGQGGGQ
ncbi:hypothetical protein LTR36_009968 [Oleoguttula mirabilis]|uniref:ATPase AAA-type core domain-containing protein n=1 Tax=Oleoguttula mirabilis TaxID=1507867 RepID=A0AAV9J6B8_9PEZI|nr:hypothetical protein LTR36_009968 [Oleoguttula mirabilis]